MALYCAVGVLMKYKVANPSALDKFFIKYFSSHLIRISRGNIGRYFMAAGFTLGFLVGFVL
tara:strand:+ start:436 stop:618 length:183 start_codon:yes stop_codon:yes gene_type:complete